MSKLQLGLIAVREKLEGHMRVPGVAVVAPTVSQFLAGNGLDDLADMQILSSIRRASGKPELESCLRLECR
jgi:hypothetical protein